MPYIDDSEFVKSLVKFRGRHASELAAHLKDNGRKYEVIWCASGMVWGLEVFLLDGNKVEVAFESEWLEHWEYRNDLVDLPKGIVIDSNYYVTSVFAKPEIKETDL